MDFKLAAGDGLVIATHNKGKLWEFERLLIPHGISTLSAEDFGVPEPEETGSTYRENAELKAVLTAKASGRPSLGDDSGLAVDALGGAPGIYSARWAGEPRNFTVAMARVKAELDACGARSPDRMRGAFICVLCLATPEGTAHFFEGRVAGLVVWPPRGENGFGYDPMFVPDGHTETFGEMEPARKYELTHRARAFAAFRAAVIAQ